MNLREHYNNDLRIYQEANTVKVSVPQSYKEYQNQVFKAFKSNKIDFSDNVDVNNNGITIAVTVPANIDCKEYVNKINACLKSVTDNMNTKNKSAKFSYSISKKNITSGSLIVKLIVKHI